MQEKGEDEEQETKRRETARQGRGWRNLAERGSSPRPLRLPRGWSEAAKHYNFRCAQRSHRRSGADQGADKRTQHFSAVPEAKRRLLRIRNVRYKALLCALSLSLSLQTAAVTCQITHSSCTKVDISPIRLQCLSARVGVLGIGSDERH